MMFEAASIWEARELCREQWLQDDLMRITSGGIPLWNGTARLRARSALPNEAELFGGAEKSDQPSDELTFVYLVQLDSTDRRDGRS
jgi:hypothetical protein